MKKVFFWIFSLVLAVGISSCGEDEPLVDNPDQPETEQPDPTPESPDEPDNPDAPENKGGKMLVVYFSRTGYNYPDQWLEIGHTARVAGFISELTGADKFEILPKNPYPDNYQETVAIAREELNNNARPEFIGKIENIDDYDIVFVGGPVWHGAMPMIIRTFYDTYDLTGKTIVPFSTHAGSGLGDCERLARSYYPQGKILQGLAVQGTNSPSSRDTVEEWLRRIGIIE